MTRVVWLASFAALALALAACGSGSGSGDDRPDGTADLLDRLPGEISEISVLDFALAKRRLGVAADLDVRDYEKREGFDAPEPKFDSAARDILLSLSPDLPDALPYAASIDAGRITAGVRAVTNEGAQLILLSTTQATGDLRPPRVG